MKTLPAILLVLLLAACSGGTTTTADVPATADVPTDVVIDSWDAAVDIAPDNSPDVLTPDILPDLAPEVLIPPDPAAFFEEQTHPSCLPDNGSADRVQQFRTVDVLPDLDVRGVALLAEIVIVGTGSGLYARPGDAETFQQVALPGDPGPTDIVGRAEGHLYVTQDAEIYMVNGALDVTPLPGPGGTVQAAFDCGDGLYMVADGVLSHTTGAIIAPVEGAPATGISDACCSGGAVWVGREDGVHRLTDDAWSIIWAPGAAVTVLAPGPDGRVLAATDTEVSALSADGPEAGFAAGIDALPTDSIRALAVVEDRWAVGHEIGVTLSDPVAGTFEHFHSKRWLPAEAVRDLAFDALGGLWIATAAGLSHLTKVDQSLEEKAGIQMENLDTWHWRLGFVSLYAHGIDPWEPVPGTQQLNDDDNDGQWTEEALAAFCYAYQVTGDEAWYQAGRKAVEGMFQLFDVPAADFEAAGLGFGYPSRSVVRDDEGGVFDSKATQSNWHLVDHWDGHQYYWKDDTSSDEVTGHLYGLAVYHDLCAKDDAEREEVAHYLSGMIGYILDNGYKLLDLDGEPTTHGHWAPEDLAIALDGVEECCEEHGIDACFGKCVESYYGSGFLNSAEILGGLLAAWHVSGEERFLDAYESLVTEHRYDEVATFGENVLTWTDSHMANYCDHELADLSFLTLLRYEPYADRRALWEQQVLASFEYEYGERNPLKTLVIASTQAEIPGLPEGVRTLHEYPADMRDWLMDNSHRVDVAPDGNDRHGNPQFATALPYDEIHLMRWDSNPYRISKGGDGTTRLTPTFWLLPYWGLRYYNAICP